MVYKKIPVSVEAFRLGYDEIPMWMQEHIRKNNVSNIDAFLEGVNEVVKIKTLEGVMNAVQGDYIVKGVKGEIYPCKAEVFEQTYEYIPLRHINIDDELAGKFIYLDEAHYLGKDEGDIIVFDETHKIVSEANEDGTVNKIYLYDKNNGEVNTIMLYENGERKLDKILVPDTFNMAVSEIDVKKIAYEFLRIKREEI
ncbi:MAG: hypothetical protein ACI4VQ_05690 [Clostridia bacterium]